MPDSRTFVPQQKIEHFRKQSQSLEQHQNKLNDELAKLEEIFNQKKERNRRSFRSSFGKYKKIM
uniref:Uncharacterized protein n=1 Tax=Meloidogyne enterolobii TaxID=390850 RepID=A0A6V7WN99_MELEN|nr:unnamed protein product [Meloidogyne enterolobii]